MEISNNLINQVAPKYPVPVYQTQQGQVVPYGTTPQLQLPSVHSAGMSQINTNLPISYTKIGEIAVPGLKEKASVYRLANGQKVIIQPKKGPTYIKTTYNVGSMNETEDIRGISHFIEHNLFNGSKDLAPKEYDKRVSDLGGGTNASTSYVQTDYYLAMQLIKDNSLEEGIRLNALQTQFPTFNAEQLEKEKEPVKSEIDMYKDDPADVALSTALKNLFNVQTNSSNFVLGTKDNINSFTRDKVLDYFNTWYTPDNAVTVITGDVDTQETINLVSKYYNKQPDLSKVHQRHYEPIQYLNRPVRTDIIQPNAYNASVYMGFAIPEGTTNEDKDKIRAMMSLLTSQDSKLTKALDAYGLFADYNIESMQNKQNGAQAIILSASATEEQIEDVIKILYQAIADIANNPPSWEDLNIYKQKAFNNLKASSETSDSLNSTLTYMAMQNDYDYFNNKVRNVQNLTPLDISETARRFLDLNKVSMCVSHEKTATPESIGNNYNKNKTISFGASLNPKESIKEEADKVRTFRLWNNIETLIVPGNSNGSSVVSINFDTDELNNVSSPAFMVFNELIERGSLYRDNDSYTKLLNAKDIGLSFSASVDGLNVSAVCEDGNLNDSLGLIKEVLNYPNFTQAEFDRAKQIIRDSILSESVSAYDKLNQELFPSIAKYASKEERLKQLDALTLADIQNLYALIMSTAQVNAAFTAPVEEKPYLKDIFNNALSSGLPVFKPVSKKNSASHNIYSPNTKAKILATADERSQAQICQAYKFKETKNIDDTVKIKLLNIILGGGMSSRLFTDLRENQKLAYSVGSGSLSEKNIASIILDIGTTTDSPDPNEGSPDNARKALEGFERNINLLKTENVSDKELEDAKNKLKSYLLDMIETNGDKTALFLASKDSLYDIRHAEAMMEAIDRVTPDDIRSAANYCFANPPITSIVASQRTLDALNLK